jgi:hypothetical protein
MANVKDVEDPAIGAGILSYNAHLFDDHAQVQNQHQILPK